MAHEFSFADVAVPKQHVVLKLPLRDYSIGHRVLLLRQRNPLLWSAEAVFNSLPFAEQVEHLIEAVYVCNQSYAHVVALEKSPTPALLKENRRNVEKWHKLHADYKAEDWTAEFAAFRNYIAAHRIVTEYESMRTATGPTLPCSPADGERGRSLGGPYDAALIQFLMEKRFVATEAEAMEYPFARAELHYLVHLEREGALKIMNHDDLAHKERMAAIDLKAAKDAGFNTVEEHVAHVTAEAEKKKSGARSQESESKTGLATEIPSELQAAPKSDEGGSTLNSQPSTS